MDSTYNPYGGYEIKPLKVDKLQQIQDQIDDMNRRLDAIGLALGDSIDSKSVAK